MQRLHLFGNGIQDLFRFFDRFVEFGILLRVFRPDSLEALGKISQTFLQLVNTRAEFLCAFRLCVQLGLLPPKLLIDKPGLLLKEMAK